MSESEVRKAGSVDSEALSPSPSQRKRAIEQKRGDEEPSERGAQPGRGAETSPLRQDKRGPSQEAKDSRQKGSRQSSGGSSCRSHQGRGHPKEKRRVRQPPSRERGRDKAESSLAKQDQARDCQHTKPRVKDRRPQPRSPERSVKRSHSLSGDTRSADPPHKSFKRPRQHSPEALSSRALSPLSRVMTRMGALQVALEELQAPGGAFLHHVVSSSSQECTVSQRAWLTWQLAHAGAALHWALHTVNGILAAQAWLPRSSQVHAHSSVAQGQCPPTGRFPGDLDCGKKA